MARNELNLLISLYTMGKIKTFKQKLAEMGISEDDFIAAVEESE